MEILVVMVVGAVVGATVFPVQLKGLNEKLTFISTALLIFSMGANLGGRDAFLEELGSLWLASLLFCLAPIAFSVLVVYVLTNVFMDDIVCKPARAHLTQAQDSVSDHGEITMIFMAIISLVLGVVYGLMPTEIVFLNVLVSHSKLILVALTFFVGISLGRDKGILGKLRQYRMRVLIIPIGIIAGSIAGGFFGAALLGLPLPVGGGIACGLGWYSLSSVMMTEIAGAQIGSITFLSSLLREIISFLMIPWIAKHLNYPTCIAPAAATSEDTTLPMLIRCTNGETVVLAVLNGILCSAMVPVLIEIFHRFI